jgi:hypothetical protein
VIGNGNVFRFRRRTQFGEPNGQLDLKPPGDCSGLYWGAFRIWPTINADYSKPGDVFLPGSTNLFAVTRLFTIEVNGVVVFSHRHIQRNWWRPKQLYQSGIWNGAGWDNFDWYDQFFNDAVPNPVNALVGAYQNLSNGAPLRSYQNAFFEPAAQGPAAVPMGFGAGVVPTLPTRFYFCNVEPVFFTANVLPGETFVLRCRSFREVPNAALNPPISDAPPQPGFAAEPDEIEIDETAFGVAIQNTEGWVVRVGPPGETLAEIGTISVNPGEPGIDV